MKKNKNITGERVKISVKLMWIWWIWCRKIETKPSYCQQSENLSGWCGFSENENIKFILPKERKFEWMMWFEWR